MKAEEAKVRLEKIWIHWGMDGGYNRSTTVYLTSACSLQFSAQLSSALPALDSQLDEFSELNWELWAASAHSRSLPSWPKQTHSCRSWMEGSFGELCETGMAGRAASWNTHTHSSRAGEESQLIEPVVCCMSYGFKAREASKARLIRFSTWIQRHQLVDPF